MQKAIQFPYITVDSSMASASTLPYLPMSLEHDQRQVSVSVLLDTGAALNVIPYDVGLKLGAIWEEQTVPVKLTGNLASSEARGIVIKGKIDQFGPVRLAFAWTKNNVVPVIMGQVNFFMEYDVCFFRSRSIFEIKPA